MATSDSPLNVPNVTLAVARGASAPDPGGPSEPDLALPAGNIVSDDFESADTLAPGYPDFDWHSNNSTSIVTMDPNLAHCVGTGPYAVYNNGEICNPDTDTTKDWSALSGKYCMRFRYAEGTNTSVFAERRWRLLNGRAEKTMWLRMAWRVPVNFVHENVPDIYGETWAASSNNKFLTMWMDGYSSNGDGSTVDLEYVMDGNGGSNLQVKLSTGRFTVVGSVGSSTPFIRVPEDRGRWKYMALKVVTESSEDADDGSIEIWEKWVGESAWTKTHTHTGLRVRVPSSGPQGFAYGYLFGADNSGFAEETEFFVDDFNLSTGSLL